MTLELLILSGLALTAAYYLCPMKGRWALLLAASYAFYAYCGAGALPYILLTTLSTWGGALCMGRIAERCKAAVKAGKATLSPDEKKALKAAAKRRQRAIFFSVLLLNFSLLAFLKYFNYAAHHIAALVNRTFALSLSAPKTSLLLPLGISFYTFQSMGYLIDVYNGKYAPEKNPARFALFVSFFPQLIQGPIGRYDQLAPQLYAPHRFDVRNIEYGAILMLWGFFKKKVIADRALPLVAEVFGHQGMYGGAVIVLGVLFYSIQQYADFSGGIDLVTGMAQMMGVRLAPNFKRPYFAASLGDFWRRWHISLGSWMRDYVFYPFALMKPVSRLSKKVKPLFGQHVSRALPAALGNILVFFIVGIWHGAQANYAVWGLYNGFILAASALLEPVYDAMRSRFPRFVKTRAYALFCILRTFVIVNIGWYFDRCERMSDAFAMLQKTFTSPQTAQLFDGTLLALGLTPADYFLLAIAVTVLFAVSLAQERGVHMRDWLFARPLALRWALLYALILFTVYFTKASVTLSSGFMYAIF